MIQCAIIEDEPLATELLAKYIAETDELTCTGQAENIQEAFSLIESAQPDLIFLDIRLAGSSGLTFYRSLIHKPEVIFTTAYPEFAIEGFELEAIDYLLKPFSYERFVAAINKTQKRLKHASPSDVLIVKEDKKSYRIKTQDILYIESIGDYAKIFTSDKCYLTNDTLKQLEAILPEGFRRAHKSYIVSLDKISFLEGNRLSIKEVMIPVGYAYRESITELFRKS